MASNVTLEFLRARSRERADMQNSGFVTQTEHDAYINSACQELYDILVSRFEDYYTEDPVNFTVTAPGDTVDLPADFYKLRGVDVLTGGSQWAPMAPFMFQERNRLQNPLLFPNYEQATAMYRLRKNKLQVLGTVNGSIQGRLWYIKAFQKLVNPTDVFDGVNGWEEHVIVNVAIKMKQKEESDVSVLMEEKKQLEDRIRNMANNRDSGSPERVTDVSINSWGPFPRF